MSMRYEPGEVFQKGERWVSPRGLVYIVDRIDMSTLTAHLHADRTGRTAHRPWDAVSGWQLFNPELHQPA